MHYIGIVRRPPYEAESLLLEVTEGCTHYSCKFCIPFNDLPFKFRMFSMEDIENDLREAQKRRISCLGVSVKSVCLPLYNLLINKMKKIVDNKNRK